MKEMILNSWQENGTLSRINPMENYDVGNRIIYNTGGLKSKLCGYNDAYILVRSDILTT